MASVLEREIDQNFDYFQRKLGEFLTRNAGQYALLRHRKVVDFYPTLSSAEAAGEETFADGMFSIQEVTGEVVDLGYFSHAVDLR